jgi:hypothetical protein
MNSLRIAQDFLRGLSLSFGGRVHLERAETLALPPDASVGAMTMTPVVFITIGFLSCWFLLYALVEWTQDRQGKSGKRRADSGINYSSQGSERVINFRNKEMSGAKKRI